MLDRQYYVSYIEGRLLFDVENINTIVFDYLPDEGKNIALLYEIDIPGLAYFTRYIIILWFIMYSAHYARLQKHMFAIKAMKFTTNRLKKKRCKIWDFIMKNFNDHKTIENICKIAGEIREKIKDGVVSEKDALVLLADNIEKYKELFLLIMDTEDE
jgi:hypothetical protein